MWLLIITSTYVLSSGGMLIAGHDEYPFADHQECLEAAARHNETFDRVRRENPTYRLHYFASCVKDGRKQEAS